MLYSSVLLFSVLQFHLHSVWLMPDKGKCVFITVFGCPKLSDFQIQPLFLKKVVMLCKTVKSEPDR